MPCCGPAWHAHGKGGTLQAGEAVIPKRIDKPKRPVIPSAREAHGIIMARPMGRRGLFRIMAADMIPGVDRV